MGLPSAGILPFMQTFVCDSGAKRSKFSTDMPIFPNAKWVNRKMLLDFYICSVSHLYGLLDDNFVENFGNDYCSILQNFQGQVTTATCGYDILNGKYGNLHTILAVNTNCNRILGHVVTQLFMMS